VSFQEQDAVPTKELLTLEVQIKISELAETEA
jgi:hypothetical protein